ncbi:MAG: uracil-DNA glycosylase [Gammaproteobacteria bacterium]
MLSRAGYLKELGIDVWVERNVHALDSDISADSAAPPVVPGWDDLASQVAACTRCPLHSSRTQTVFGNGARTAQLMVIGEAPGAEEDKQGEPFVGRAGHLLNSMLLALGYQREEVFIANILKCRPPNNRDPKAEEAAACANYLSAQIALLKPKLIVAVGRVAAQNLLGVDTPIGKMRGKPYFVTDRSTGSDIPVVVTYHPAYLLRSPLEKRKAWGDLTMAKNTLKNSLRDTAEAQR